VDDVDHAGLRRMDLAEAELRLLTRAAVQFRYPGEAADESEAAAALAVSTRMRERLTGLLDQAG
jgi:hypothetical protein